MAIDQWDYNWQESYQLSKPMTLKAGTVLTLEAEYEGRGYGDLKKDVADAVTSTFSPIRARALELLDDPAELDRILSASAARANEIAEHTLATVYDRIGLIPRR